MDAQAKRNWDAHCARLAKAEQLGDHSKKFWLIACHVEGPEYLAHKGAGSPPRVKFGTREEAEEIAKQMVANYRGRFYVLEAVSVFGEFTTKEYKEARKKEQEAEEDDSWLD